MSDFESRSAAEPADPDVEAPARKRPKPGERRVQILQALAAMLEQPGGERITTAALAARLEVSEAALYRHFASKAQMFEGLIEFIEQSVFSLISQITTRAPAMVASRWPASWRCCFSSARRIPAWPVSWWAMPWCSRTSGCSSA